jgi:hypothetical protein
MVDRSRGFLPFQRVSLAEMEEEDHHFQAVFASMGDPHVRNSAATMVNQKSTQAALDSQLRLSPEEYIAPALKNPLERIGKKGATHSEPRGSFVQRVEDLLQPSLHDLSCSARQCLALGWQGGS